MAEKQRLLSLFLALALPAALREIGSNAFSGSGLTSLILPKGFQTMGAYAFRNCASLERAALPGSLAGGTAPETTRPPAFRSFTPRNTASLAPAWWSITPGRAG